MVPASNYIPFFLFCHNQFTIIHSFIFIEQLFCVWCSRWLGEEWAKSTGLLATWREEVKQINKYLKYLKEFQEWQGHKKKKQSRTKGRQWWDGRHKEEQRLVKLPTQGRHLWDVDIGSEDRMIWKCESRSHLGQNCPVRGDSKEAWNLKQFWKI